MLLVLIIIMTLAILIVLYTLIPDLYHVYNVTHEPLEHYLVDVPAEYTHKAFKFVYYHTPRGKRRHKMFMKQVKFNFKMAALNGRADAKIQNFLAEESRGHKEN